MEAVLKSAKMILNEIGVKKKVTPKYNTSQEINDNTMPPRFTSVCIYPRGPGDNVEGTGTSGTKKDAEQKAATNIILKLLVLQDLDSGTTADLQRLLNFSLKAVEVRTDAYKQTETDGLDNEPVSDTDDDQVFPGEPIGELNTICQKSKSGLPQFTEEHRRGPRNTNVFTVTCNVGTRDGERISYSGRRLKKQDAKKIAAFRVLRDLKNRSSVASCSSSAANSNQNSPPRSPIKVVSSHISITVKEKVEANDTIQKTDDESPLQRSLASIMKELEGSAKGVLGFSDLVVDESRLYSASSDTNGNLSLSPSSKPLEKAVDEIFTLKYFQSTLKIDGGSLDVFKKAAADINLKHQFRPSISLRDGLSVCVFLVLEFPSNSDFQRIRHKTHVVHGIGRDVETAREDAAMKALQFLQEMFSDDSTASSSLLNRKFEIKVT